MGWTEAHAVCTTEDWPLPGSVGAEEYTWGITVKSSTVPHKKAEFIAHGKLCLEEGENTITGYIRRIWVFSVFQHEEAPQCPYRNYFEKLMQTFERKEERKKQRKNRFICLYMTIWSLVDKYKPTFFFSLSSPTEAAVLLVN